MTTPRRYPDKSFDNFRVYTDIAHLPMGEKAAYINEGFTGICTGGNAIIEVFSTTCRISKGDLVAIFPLQLTSIHDISDDFQITFFKVEKGLFMDMMNGTCRMTPDFFFYMRHNFRYHLSENEAARFLNFMGLIRSHVDEKKTIYRKETTINLLRIFYWDLFVHYKEDTEAQKAFRFTNKEKIAFKFAMLIIEHHKTTREVAFYADKLCISPKYLTMVMQQVNRQSASECIAEYVILEIKALLRNADLDIKDVVRQTGFPSQTTLSAFFRRHTGMSPSEYRESVHLL